QLAFSTPAQNPSQLSNAGARCLRLERTLAVEMHENWIEDIRYLNMDDLREHKKEVLRRLDTAA
ncbi:MAG TPA: hypothetical protein PLP31_14670, partial [Thermoanaerobaculaceae bacterium]|nr:hypothetical protein [Thermoanaerobaculaceae bacterium]